MASSMLRHSNIGCLGTSKLKGPLLSMVFILHYSFFSSKPIPVIAFQPIARIRCFSGQHLYYDAGRVNELISICDEPSSRAMELRQSR